VFGFKQLGIKKSDNQISVSAKGGNLITLGTTGFLMTQLQGTGLAAERHIYIYICRTAQLTSRRCILNINSTNVRTEYFKHVA
jgi:hypothetical protein